MHNFNYYVPTDIFFGKGQISQLPAQIKKYGSSVLLVYGGGSIKKTGIYDTIVNQMKENGIPFQELSGVEPRVSSSISPLPARQNFMFLLYRISPDFQGENAKYRVFLRKKLQNMRFLEIGSLDFPFARRRRKRA